MIIWKTKTNFIWRPYCKIIK